VVVEDALDIEHGLVGGNAHGDVEAIAEETEGDDGEDPECERGAEELHGCLQLLRACFINRFGLKLGTFGGGG
jgi:hypothetical protein